MREFRQVMAAQQGEQSSPADDLQSLRDEVEKVTGQKPHHKMGEGKLRQILAEAKAAA